jgi:hypothetical protein
MSDLCQPNAETSSVAYVSGGGGGGYIIQPTGKDIPGFGKADYDQITTAGGKKSVRR